MNVSSFSIVFHVFGHFQMLDTKHPTLKHSVAEAKYDFPKSSTVSASKTQNAAVRVAPSAMESKTNRFFELIDEFSPG